MAFDMTTIFVAVVFGIVALVALLRGKVSVTGLIEASTDIQTAAGAARELVLAAEQLWLSGKITKHERYQYVLTRLQEIFPDMEDDTLAGSIEAAVAWMKLLRGRSNDE
ncbi:MAG: hypothetical protein DCC55_11405 [Chloroflexi bacterium]|nr:MAG: hypothetical protein DCC55_11405 [Chloroflexota bacterium]